MGISDLKQSLLLNVKNMHGWKTNRKIVVFSVDDYGNVRLDSKEARDELDKAGIKVLSPFKGFDLYDTLETKDDLEILFDALSSVKDKHGRHAVFTPFAVPCNIDFEKVKESGFHEFHNELLPVTYEKLSADQPHAYKGAWNLWQEGIEKKLMVPQFHGREHVNLNAFDKLMAVASPNFITTLRNRSFARIESNSKIKIASGEAFDFWNLDENERFYHIIEDGLNAFENTFGSRAVHFIAPGGKENPYIYRILQKNGIKYVDLPLIKKELKGKGKYKTGINYTGKRNKFNQLFLVRNVVFEPTRGNGKDGASHALKQIEAAFRWNRPAIISSHRVNFCGHIDEKNRKRGIDELKELLGKIVRRWPDVEFMAANELGDIIQADLSEGK